MDSNSNNKLERYLEKTFAGDVGLDGLDGIVGPNGLDGADAIDVSYFLLFISLLFVLVYNFRGLSTPSFRMLNYF